MKADKIRILFASIGLVAAAALAGVAYSLNNADRVNAADTSAATISAPSTSVVAGKEFTIKVSGTSKYTDNYWHTQTIMLYSDSYTKVSFVKAVVDKTSDGAEAVVGSGIVSNTSYKVGVNFDNKTGRKTSEAVTYTVTFKANADLAEGTKLNFYLKPDAVYSYYPTTVANESKTQISISHKQAAPLTVTVKKEKTSKITYNLNGGTNPGTAPSTYVEGSATNLPTPTKSGYTFDGWYEKSDFSGSKVTSIPATATGDKTFYAKWTEKKSETPEDPKPSNPTAEKVTLTFSVNNPDAGTVEPTSIEVEVGSKIKTNKNVLVITSPDGAEQEVRATPTEADPNDEGEEKPKSYQFKNWTGVPKTVTEDVEITANFVEKGNFNWLYVICGALVLSDFLIFFIPYKKNFNQPKGGK